MSRVRDAVFEDGVFKPLRKVDIKEHEKVTINVMPLEEWQTRFDRIIRKIHSKAAQYPSEEIEADIRHALREVREGKGES